MSEAERPWKAINPESMTKPVGYANAINLTGGILAWAEEIDPEMPVY